MILGDGSEPIPSLLATRSGVPMTGGLLKPGCVAAAVTEMEGGGEKSELPVRLGVAATFVTEGADENGDRAACCI